MLNKTVLPSPLLFKYSCFPLWYFFHCFILFSHEFFLGQTFSQHVNCLNKLLSHSLAVEHWHLLIIPNFSTGQDLEPCPPIHILTPILLNIHHNAFFASTSCFFKSLLSKMFPHKNSLCLSWQHLRHACLHHSPVNCQYHSGLQQHSCQVFNKRNSPKKCIYKITTCEIEQGNRVVVNLLTHLRHLN